jgi:two-component system, OmpR family, alkaline phosphatase synthesis response regulator PhoP
MTRVLVIDDDPGVRVVLQRNLEHASFEVLTAEDGPTGLTAAREQAPDIVVLDLLLPYADGFEVLQKLANDASTAALPVIVLTALTGPEVKDKCREAGADHVMTKPFDPSALASEIHRILALSSTIPL